MAKGVSVYQPRLYKTEAVTLVNADGTTSKTLLTAGADDAIVKSLLITSTDTSARVVELILDDGTTEFVLASFNVAITAGTDGATAVVDALTASGLPLDSAGKKILPLETGMELKVRAQVAVTAAKVINFVATVEEF